MIGRRIPKEQNGTLRSYHGVKRRCYPFGPNFSTSGFTMCDKWIYSFDGFLADMGIKPRGSMLALIGDATEFNKDNCEWVVVDDSLIPQGATHGLR